MIPGMYFPREHSEQLRGPASQGTARRGRVWLCKRAQLDNTTFGRLVESGLIGTTGISTDLLYQQIVLSFNGKESLVVATLHGEDMPSRHGPDWQHRAELPQAAATRGWAFASS